MPLLHCIYGRKVWRDVCLTACWSLIDPQVVKRLLRPQNQGHPLQHQSICARQTSSSKRLSVSARKLQTVIQRSLLTQVRHLFVSPDPDKEQRDELNLL